MSAHVSPAPGSLISVLRAAPNCLLHQPANQHRLTAIDGLRGYAILAVTVFHLWFFGLSKLPVSVFGLRLDRLFEWGANGVGLFFALSGFCLYYPIARGRQAAWVNFYQRRVARIMPAYLVALLALSLVHHQSTWVGIWRHLLFVHTFSQPHIFSVVGVAWSLGTEVQFYLLFPLLVFAARRCDWSLLLILSTAATCTARIIGMDGYTTPCPVTASLSGHLSTFLWGMAAATVIASSPPLLRRPHIRYGLWLVGFSPILMAPFISGRMHLWQWANPLLGPGWTALIVAAVSDIRLSRLWSARPLVGLGVISYSVYLYQDLIWMTFNRWGIRQGLSGCCLVFCALIVIGVIGYLLIERPFLRLRQNLRRSEQPPLAQSTSQFAPGPAAICSVSPGTRAG